MSTYAFPSADQAVCAYIEGGLGRLGLLDLGTGKLTPLDLPFTEYGAIRAAGGKVVFRAGSPNTPASIVGLTGTRGRRRSSARRLRSPTTRP